MNIKKEVVGILQTNCYILEKNNEVLVIDPGDDFPKIDKHLINKKVVGIILTHNHSDHTGAVQDIVNKYHSSVYDNTNLSKGINKIGSFQFEVISTNGHTNDSVTIYFKDNKCMFVGDFIFRLGIGRWDLPTGNIKDMLLSIEKIKKYPNDTTIYPGHGEPTTLGYEKENNEYLCQINKI